MLVLLNTAKTFTGEKAPSLSLTEPVFKIESELLVEVMKNKSIAELEKLLHASQKIAELNHSRYANWSNCQKMPALHGFNGDIYKKLKEQPLTKKNWGFAQKHLRIISGLYGILKPMDGINPYRLEMYTKLKVASKKDLHDFWREKLTKQLSLEIDMAHAEFILNLASKEYSSAIELAKLQKPVIDVDFLEKTPKGNKVVAIYAKYARGRMARYVIDNQIVDPAQLKTYDLDGYEFESSLSTDNKLTFIRGCT